MISRSNPWIIATVLLVAFGLFCQVLPAWGQGYDPELDLPKPTHLEKSLTKLGRGFSNVLLGWAEIPMTFDKKMKAGKPFGYLVGVVPVVGTARAIMRTGVGFYEIATCPWSDEDVNYEPLLQPEYIF